MPQPALVTEYLDALTRELRFDLALARRVRQEAEDHLLEAISEEPDRADAANHAITRFGDPREIARLYAPTSLMQQVRRVGALLIVSIAAILVLMKTRAVVFEFLQWRVHPDWLGVIAPTIDRYAFQVSLILGVLGWIYIASRRASPAAQNGSWNPLKRCLLLPIVTASLLGGSVILDAALAGLRIVHVQVSVASALLLASIAIEATLVLLIATLLRRTFQSAALAAPLLAGKTANGSLPSG